MDLDLNANAAAAASAVNNNHNSEKIDDHDVVMGMGPESNNLAAVNTNMDTSDAMIHKGDAKVNNTNVGNVVGDDKSKTHAFAGAGSTGAVGATSAGGA